jgi:hypothetical protein
MPGALPHLKHGPDSYQVSAQVLGGQLVVADGSSATTVSVAGAGAANVLGVAGADAAPVVSQAGNVTGYGQPVVDISVLPDYVPVYHGADMHVTYAATATFGALLKSAATGQVTPWVSGTDAAGLIVGRCTQPGGVAVSAGGVVGRARIFG